MAFKPGIIQYYFSNIDPDAEIFLNAASITDNTIVGAVDKLVKDLKNYELWAKMKAVYPFVGGTSSTHKWNLKDPRDLDEAYRLIFNGGLTHYSGGVMPNGFNAYINTNIIPSTSLSVRNTHLSFYSLTDSAPGLKFDIGCGNSDTLTYNMQFKRANNIVMSDCYNGYTNRIEASNIVSQGLFITTRISIDSHKIFKNEDQIGLTDSVNETGNSLPSYKLTLFACNVMDNLYYFSDRGCAFASIGEGLTDANASNLYAAVQAFQTTLNRQI